KNETKKVAAAQSIGQAKPSVQQPDGPDSETNPSSQPGKGFVGPTSDGEGAPAEQPKDTAPVKPPTLGGRLTDVELQTMDAFHARLNFKSTTKAGVSVKLLSEPTRLAVDIPNCAIETEQKDWTSEHPFLSGYHASEGDKPGTARVVVD